MARWPSTRAKDHGADQADAVVETTQAVLDYARACFTCSVGNLLDDPSHLLHEWRDEEPADDLQGRRRLAHDLGLNFDAMVRKLGTPFEQERLHAIESGKVVPRPRKPLR